MKSVACFVGTLLVILVTVSMVGCASQRQFAQGVKYEMREQISVKQEFVVDKPTLPSVSAEFIFSACR